VRQKVPARSAVQGHLQIGGRASTQLQPRTRAPHLATTIEYFKGVAAEARCVDKVQQLTLLLLQLRARRRYGHPADIWQEK
jgi:hypothetical protein